MSVLDRADAALFDMLGDALTAPAIHSTIGEDEPRARATDAVSSHAAADSISPEAVEASERFVYVTLRDHGPVTDDFVIARSQQEGQPWEPSRLRTARLQLVKKGAVRLHEERGGTTRKGRAADLWAVAS